MRRYVQFGVLFGLFAIPAQAGPLHYLKAHKQLIARDIVISGVIGADAYSSTRCRGCIEEDPLLGQHPSQFETYSFAVGFSALYISLNHLLARREPGQTGNVLDWMGTGVLGVTEIWQTHANLDAAKGR